jgi:signal transduction histidine kinase
MTGPDDGARGRDEFERAKLESLAEFAAGAGHEINNPLAVITGRAQLLLRGERDPERRRDLAIIHAQAMRIHEMIADLMLFARPPLPKLQSCEASAIVDATVAGLAAKAETLGVALVRSGSSQPIELTADADQLQIALRAVVDNGLNAVAPSGRVEVELRSGDDAVEFVVRDDGSGISPELREHIFDPFFSGREAGRGLGVGLSKAWRIVTNHGGTIAVEANSPQGAMFTLRVPFVSAEPGRDGPAI